MIDENIYSYVLSQERNYESDEIQLGDNWHWSMREHIQLLFHLKNDQFFTGANDWMRPFKNIIEPILNLAYWTEDIEVKDVVFFIEQSEGRALSFLLKKYHDEVYTKEHDLDTLFDDIAESDIDYGGVLVQKGFERPEIVTLNSIAFADQTDIMGGPFGVKTYFTPEGLRAMSKSGWGDEKNGATISIDELINLATFEKDPLGTVNEKNNVVPGKAIEVFLVRGDLPEHYLEDNDNMEDYSNQIQIIAFYTDKEGHKEGVTLYRKEGETEDVRFHTSKKIPGRGLGRGVGESLLQSQIWTNFLEIHKTGMLEAGAKVPLVTDDPTWTQKNKIQDMENLEVTTIEDGKSVNLVPTISPVNVQLYDQAADVWLNQAQFVGSAFDPILGKEAVSGTTFRGQERTVAQGRGLHERRKGQRAKFLEILYREWIIPDMVKEITSGKEFMATLSAEELTYVADQLVTKQVNAEIKDMLLSGKVMTAEEQAELVAIKKDLFLKTGNKQLLKIAKKEFKGIEIKVGVNIANKQKNLADLSDKVLSIFQFVFANPAQFQQAMQVPALSKAFGDILEFSGMNIADFSSLINTNILPQPEQEGGEESPKIDSLLSKQKEQLK